jgi:hypothetical protein
MDHDNLDTQMDAVDLVDLLDHRGDLPSAERFARRALAADPRNCLALNILGVVHYLTGRESEAMDILRRTKSDHPGDPNAYYSLAKVLSDGGRSEQSLMVLEELFAKVALNSPGFERIFSYASSLCEQVQRTLAEQKHAGACGAVDAFRRTLESRTGYPIVVFLDDMPPQMGASLNSAFTSGKGRHVIRCNRSFPATFLQPLVASQLMRIELAYEVRAAGKARSPVSTPAHIRFMQSIFRPRPRQMERLRTPGFSDETILRAAAEGLHNLMRDLFNVPPELIAESRVRERLPILSAAQFLCGGYILRRAPNPSQTLSRPNFTPLALLRVWLALDCVRARFHDSLFGGTTAFASAYTHTEVHPLASRLWHRWETAARPIQPGDEYCLIDEFAGIVGLRQAYDWIVAPTT